MTKLTKYLIVVAIVEAVAIGVLVYILFSGVDSDELQKIDELEIKLLEARNDRARYQRANEEESAKWAQAEADYIKKIKELETTKSQNNEKLGVDVAIRRDVRLDSLIVIGARQQHERPTNY